MYTTSIRTCRTTGSSGRTRPFRRSRRCRRCFFGDICNALRLTLWDEAAGKLVAFRDVVV
jgi:hypothetical protein